jgi:cytochrome c oxidase assembly protein subunit 15
VLTCAIALFTSRWWQNIGRDALPRIPNFQNEAAQQRGPTVQNLRWLVLFTTILIFVQLIIAAAMRHQHAGLAIPDFPLAYGNLWPSTSAEAVADYNTQRVSVNAENPITASQIELQMAHRGVALAILICVGICAWRVRGIGAPGTAPARMGNNSESAETVLGAPIYQRLSLFWLGLIVFQVGLGAATIWTNKAADVATAHVLVGALALAVGALWCAIAFRESVAAIHDRRTEQRHSPGAATIGAQPAMTGNK